MKKAKLKMLSGVSRFEGIELFLFHNRWKKKKQFCRLLGKVETICINHGFER